MANDEHVAMLKKGVEAWNEWRDENPGIRPALSAADLREVDLFKASLAGADLTMADLRKANLRGANLYGTYLWGADLRGAGLGGANLREADFSGARLFGADLSRADLNRANLRGAFLNGADLAMADLTNADMAEADLDDCKLTGATLNDANLTRAKLVRANLSRARLARADLTEAFLGRTMFGDTTLTEVKGLKDCTHLGRSIIDFETLKNSGPLPTAFLRGVGLPDLLIDYLPSLLNEAIRLYSCFISYSSKDQAFAERLHADLQSKGVRCWFAPHDMRIGAKIVDAIDEAIRLRDKVLLILSEAAIASDWVEGEVTRALDEERTRKQVILFPVRIDDAVMQTTEAWARLLRGQRHIGDFTGWKDHDSYQKSFDRLMRDLRVETPAP